MSEVKRYDVDTSIGDSCFGIMTESETGDYVHIDDYVAAVQRAERAEAASNNYAMLLQRAANSLGIPEHEKIVPALIPAIHSLRASLTEKLSGLDMEPGGLIVLTVGLPDSFTSARDSALAIARITHGNVVILPEGTTISSLSVDDMGAAGWVPKG